MVIPLLTPPPAPIHTFYAYDSLNFFPCPTILLCDFDTLSNQTNRPLENLLQFALHTHSHIITTSLPETLLLSKIPYLSRSIWHWIRLGTCTIFYIKGILLKLTHSVYRENLFSLVSALLSLPGLTILIFHVTRAFPEIPLSSHPASYYPTLTREIEYMKKPEHWIITGDVDQSIYPFISKSFTPLFFTSPQFSSFNLPFSDSLITMSHSLSLTSWLPCLLKSSLLISLSSSPSHPTNLWNVLFIPSPSIVSHNPYSTPFPPPRLSLSILSSSFKLYHPFMIDWNYRRILFHYGTSTSFPFFINLGHSEIMSATTTHDFTPQPPFDTPITWHDTTNNILFNSKSTYTHFEVLLPSVIWYYPDDSLPADSLAQSFYTTLCVCISHNIHIVFFQFDCSSIKPSSCPLWTLYFSDLGGIAIHISIENLWVSRILIPFIVHTFQIRIRISDIIISLLFTIYPPNTLSLDRSHNSPTSLLLLDFIRFIATREWIISGSLSLSSLSPGWSSILFDYHCINHFSLPYHPFPVSIMSSPNIALSSLSLPFPPDNSFPFSGCISNFYSDETASINTNLISLHHNHFSTGNLPRNCHHDLQPC